MKSFLFFDLDGTLTDPKVGITRSVQYALQHFGISAATDDLEDFIGPPLEERFGVRFGLNKEQCKQAVLFFQERFSVTGKFENAVYPGIPPMLGALKDAGFHLSIATSKPTVFSVQIAERFGLTPFFDAIIGSEMDGRREQKCDVIREAMRVAGCRPEEVIMIGDRKYDILGAKICGLSSIGVRYGYAAAGELEEAGADRLVNTPEELLFLTDTIKGTKK